MSNLVAEKYGLNLAKRNLTPDEEFFHSKIGEGSEDRMENFKVRINSFQRFKEIKTITTNLEDVTRRVGFILNEAGFAADLPEPEISSVGENIHTDFQTLLETSREKIKSEAASDKANQQEANRIFEAFDETTKIRYELMTELMDWLTQCQNSVSRHEVTLFERKMKQAEKDETKSFHDVMFALKKAGDAFKKVQSIGKAVFESDADMPLLPKSRINNKTRANLNERIRKASVECDMMSHLSRINDMRNLFQLNDLPNDLDSLQNLLEKDEESDEKMLLEISKNWEEVSKEVRDIMISVHESKVLKRPLKLSLRRALYLWKLLQGLMTVRSKELKAKDSEVLRYKTEVTGFASKVEHLHRETKMWREKWSTTQAQTNKNAKEKKVLNQNIESLKETCSKKDEQIVELQNRITEMSTSTKPRAKDMSAAEDDKAAMKEEKNKSKKLKDTIKKLGGQIEVMDKQMKKMSKEHEEEIEKGKQSSHELQQKISNLDDSLNDSKRKLKIFQTTIEETQSELSKVQADLEQKEKELADVLRELRGKEEIIKNMIYAAANNEMLHPKHAEGLDLEKKSSLRPRRSGRLGENVSGVDFPGRDKKTADGISRKVTGSSSSDSSGAKAAMKQRRSTAFLDDADAESKDKKGKKSKKAAKGSKKSKKSGKEADTSNLTPKASDDVDFSEPTEKSGSTDSQVRSASLDQARKDAKEMSREAKKGQAPSMSQDDLSSLQLFDIPAIQSIEAGKANVTGTEEYQVILEELQKVTQERDKLENEVIDLSQEMQKMEDEYDKETRSVNRQLKLANLLEIERHKEITAKTYAELLQAEALVQSFKANLSKIYDQSWMTTAAKAARTAYNYRSPLDTEEWVESARLATKNLEIGLDGMFQAIAISIDTAKQAQRELKRRSEFITDQETAHHLKVLGDKADTIENLQIEAELLQTDLQKAKVRYQALLLKKEKSDGETLELINERDALLRKIQDLEEGLMLEKRKGMDQTEREMFIQTNDILESTLRQVKVMNARIKHQLAEALEALSHEKDERHKLEELLIEKQSKADEYLGDDSRKYSMFETKRLSVMPSVDSKHFGTPDMRRVSIHESRGHESRKLSFHEGKKASVYRKRKASTHDASRSGIYKKGSVSESGIGGDGKRDGLHDRKVSIYDPRNASVSEDRKTSTSEGKIAAKQRKISRTTPKGILHHPSVQHSGRLYKGYQQLHKSKTSRCVRAVKQLSEVGDVLRIYGIDLRLLEEAQVSGDYWNECVSQLWIFLVQKYCKLRLFQQLLTVIRNKILHLMRNAGSVPKVTSRRLTISMLDPNDTTEDLMLLEQHCKEEVELKDLPGQNQMQIKEELWNLQACYWHIQSKKRQLLSDKMEEPTRKTQIETCRQQVYSTFNRLAKSFMIKQHDITDQEEEIVKEVLVEKNAEHLLESIQSLASKSEETLSSEEKDDVIEKIVDRCLVANTMSITIEKRRASVEKTIKVRKPAKEVKIKEEKRVEIVEEAVTPQTDSNQLTAPPTAITEYLSDDRQARVQAWVDNTLDDLSTTGTVSSKKDFHSVPTKDASIEEKGDQTAEKTVIPPLPHTAPIIQREAKEVFSSPPHRIAFPRPTLHRTAFARSQFISKKHDRQSLRQHKVNMSDGRGRCATAPARENQRTEDEKWIRGDAYNNELRVKFTGETRQKSADFTRQLPQVVELDVRRDLRQIRKALQNNMRQHIMLTGEATNRPLAENPAREIFLTTKERVKLQNRRQNSRYLGHDGDMTPPRKMDTEELIALAKAEQSSAARPYPIPRYGMARSLSCIADTNSTVRSISPLSSYWERKPCSRPSTAMSSFRGNSLDGQQSHSKSEICFFVEDKAFVQRRRHPSEQSHRSLIQSE